jgi:hypothetical protein
MDKIVTIRKAIISDSSEITNITQECFNEYGPPLSEIIIKLISNNRGYIITYEIQKVIFYVTGKTYKKKRWM